MNIGIPKESRPSEYRVGMSPAGVKRLTNREHKCFVEHDAGKFAGFSDLDFENAGATIVYSAHEAFARADLVLKVARPQESELALIRPGAILCGFLHLAAASQSKIDTLLENKITTIAYEQIQRSDGKRPVMRMMSELGGSLLPQIAAHLLQNNTGGKGILLNGAAGIPPAEVVVIGAGMLGLSAIKAFCGAGANITALDISTEALQNANAVCPRITTMYATKANIEMTCMYADVVIAAAGIPGQIAPQIITREILKKMKPRSIIIDAGIDQGGCLETSRPTTHENPTFIVDNVIHYCVPNISSIVARTATNAFSNVIFQYIDDVANLGIEAAVKANPEIQKAVCTHEGKIQNLLNLTHD
ncbi:MAG: alanine dehydrogenase [Anaerolineales bacterium]|nr:alanine dehydrogenase [Anaerolineales bacterium]